MKNQENEPTHTLGEWKIVIESAEDFQGVMIQTENADICEVFTDFSNKDEAKANARLIQSAPNMLNALKGLAIFIESYKKEQGVDLSTHEVFRIANEVVCKIELKKSE